MPPKLARFFLAAALLLLTLWITACRGELPAVTPAAPTQLPATATLTASPSRTPTRTATVTPSPTATPTATAALLDVQMQRHSKLSVRWGSPQTFNDYVEAGGRHLMVGNESFPVEMVYVVDTRTGEQIWSYNVPREHDLNYFTDGQRLFVAECGPDEEQWAILRAYTLPSMQEIWKADFDIHTLIPLFANTEGLLVWQDDDSYYGTQNQLYQLNPLSGSITWQIGVEDRDNCYSVRPNDAFYYESKIRLACDDFILFIDFNTGDMLHRERAMMGTTSIAQSRPVYAGPGLIYQGREISGKGWHVNALDLSNPQTPETLWTQPASFYGGIASYLGDVIHQDGTSIIRRDQKTGEVVWQTELVPKEIVPQASFDIAVVGSRVLAGSNVGLVYLLDAETGQLLWEQDIWASFEPRYMRIHPLSMTAEGIYLSAQAGFRKGAMLLGLDGGSTLPSPTPRPTDTPEPATPTSVFTPAPTGELPAPPENLSDWPGVMATYLNTAPKNLATFTGLLKSWEQADPERPFVIEWKKADLTGDGYKEVIVIVGNWGEGLVAILGKDAQEQYQPVYIALPPYPQFEAIQDLDRDNQLDLVYSSQNNGPSALETTIMALKWEGAAFVDLSGRNVFTTNVDWVKVQNLLGDAKLEILLHGGTWYSGGAGPTRAATRVYGLVDGQYELVATKNPEPTGDRFDDYYFWMMDANALLVAGDAQGAIHSFKAALAPQVISDNKTELVGYSKDITPLFEHMYAFAEYQLMLGYLMQGDEAQAEVWATTGHYPDQFYTQIKDVFWKTYLESHDWTTAAEAARLRARFAGYDTIQLIPWVGFANQEMELENVCPCEACPDGYIGSQWID